MAIAAGVATAAPPAPTISASFRPSRVAVYDFGELLLRVPPPAVADPFTDVEVTATLSAPGRGPVEVQGFCDSDDRSQFRVRFMPRQIGTHQYTVRYAVPSLGVEHVLSGTFVATPSRSKGPVRIDSDHPFHFVREGTGEHYFYSGATAYHVLSWKQSSRTRAHLSRIATAGANRVRFLLYGRASDDEWSEGMAQSSRFVWTLSPWPARQRARQLTEGSIEPDHSRFDLAHFRRAEMAIRTLRDRDVVASVNLYMDRGISREYGPDDAPEAFSDEEQLYFRYAVARLGAFSNVMWDLGTEHDEYRSAEWAEWMGNLVRAWDPYDHLVTVHPNAFRPAYLSQGWYDFAEHQYYGVAGDSFGSSILERVNRHIRHWREESVERGRPIPQVNEEYGYELDPSGYDEPPAQVRKKAWAIVMGGGYLTSGEHKAWQHGDPTNGGQVRADTKILRWTKLMRDFFEKRRIPYWEMTPMDELDGTGSFGLAKPGERYVVYLPQGGAVELALPAGSTFSAVWFRPTTGATLAVSAGASGDWRSPPSPPADGEDDDWVLDVVRVGS